ncbi:MAG: tRNA pseudouridine(38-40) synthase TruA [Candidatus Omnitrophota bacterium]|jgi:tRNA pseudouridine38-40 synthase|nr:MAG: tRNA pseudouridine(38-40) synthase TruA [Candidatus Omnitrophota bacterium]
MRNIRLDLEYDGQNYCGWQWQPNLPTIEATVKTAVETMLRHEITLYSSGRTDAGVHAEQHVAHFFSDTRLQAIHLLKGLNSLLPDDIVVYRVLDMPIDWRARHDALEREYRYSFYNHIVSSALQRHRTLWIREPLHIEAMRQAAKRLEGNHDFSAFRNIHCDAEHPVRTMLEVSVHDQSPLIHLCVRGHAFLRHQVRTFAGTLLQVGLNKIPPDEIGDILRSKDRKQAGPTLAAHALTLVAVRYEGDEERFFDFQRLIRAPQ